VSSLLFTQAPSSSELLEFSNAAFKKKKRMDGYPCMKGITNLTWHFTLKKQCFLSTDDTEDVGVLMDA
jgi:hypothetical protein